MESNTIIYDAQKQKVHAVTIFKDKHAEVTRKISADLKQGQNIIEVKYLPSCIVADSLRAQGLSESTSYLMQVIFHYPPNILAGEEENALTKELETLGMQSEVLGNYFQTLRDKNTNPEAFIEFLDKYAAKQRDIHQRIKTVEIEQENMMSARLEKGKQAAGATIIIQSKNEGPVDISLSYLVSGVSWKPHYEINVFIPAESKDHAYNSVRIGYRATISQETGEDWSNVHLALCVGKSSKPSHITPSSKSTEDDDVYTIAHPLFKRPSERVGFQLHLQSMWRSLAIEAPPAKLESKNSQENSKQLASELESQCIFREEQDTQSFSRPVTGKLITAQASDEILKEIISLHKISKDAFTGNNDGPLYELNSSRYVFSVPGLFNISSNHSLVKAKKLTHTVFITEIVCEHERIALEWYMTPIETTAVSIRCTVQITSPIVLIEGSFNLFLNGKFVSRADLPLLEPSEKITLSLGVDNSIKYFEILPQVIKKESEPNKIGLNRETKIYTQGIKFFNSRPIAINKLVVYDKLTIQRPRYEEKHKYDKRIKPAKLDYTCPPHGWSKIALEWVVKPDWNEDSDEDN